MKENGQLSYNLKTFNVKHIPKKGDLRSISNWRPICLLSVYYKIISTVIANRLKKVIEKICGKWQKGYSPSKN